MKEHLVSIAPMYSLRTNGCSVKTRCKYGYEIQELFHGATIFEKWYRLMQGEFQHVTMGYASKRVNNTTENQYFPSVSLPKKRAASCLY